MAEVKSATTEGGYVIEEDGDDYREYHVDVEDGEASIDRVVVYEGRGASEAEDPDIPDSVSELLLDLDNPIEEVAWDYDGASDDAEGDADEDEAQDTSESDDADETAADGAGVETINGVGESRAATLREAGVETVQDVLDAGVDGLVEDVGLSRGIAENIVEAAA